MDAALLRHEAQLSLTEEGLVTYAGEGIVRVTGLPNASSEELIRFTGGVSGMVFNLDESEIGVILLDDMTGLEAGSAAYRTGRVLDVPVGESLLGRVVDALGRPLDDRGQYIRRNAAWPNEILLESWTVTRFGFHFKLGLNVLMPSSRLDAGSAS